VVLGSRGLGGFTGLVVGSIAVAVATHGHCPVVVVRGAGAQPEPRQDGPVVVGVDGSSTSQAAIPFAFQAAGSRNVPLVAVHAWSDLPLAIGWGTTAEWQSIRQQESELLDVACRTPTRARPASTSGTANPRVGGPTGQGPAACSGSRPARVEGPCTAAPPGRTLGVEEEESVMTTALDTTTTGVNPVEGRCDRCGERAWVRVVLQDGS
jgi:hypothetical protein